MTGKHGKCVGVLLLACLACGPRASRAQPARNWLVGGDISALTVLEQQGAVFHDNGKQGDVIAVMCARGCNCFRLRIFVNPSGKGMVVNDTAYTLALAKRIKAVGATLLLDFHYSDTWADPGQQFTPAAWEHLNGEALEEMVQTYTHNTLRRFEMEGALPEYVQIGNEIDPGLLWPSGKLWNAGDPDTQLGAFTRLLKAAARGVLSVGSNRPPRIVIHISCGGNWEQVKRFFRRAEMRGVPYDVIGLSFYPWWHGTMADIRETTHAAASQFNKDVWVVETAFPWRSMHARQRYKMENMEHPQTPQGQAQFVRDLIRIVRTVPDNHGLGVLWWHPESIPVDGVHVWHGGETALFDDKGNALQALQSLGCSPDN